MGLAESYVELILFILFSIFLLGYGLSGSALLVYVTDILPPSGVAISFSFIFL